MNKVVFLALKHFKSEESSPEREFCNNSSVYFGEIWSWQSQAVVDMCFYIKGQSLPSTFPIISKSVEVGCLHSHNIGPMSITSLVMTIDYNRPYSNLTKNWVGCGN